MRIVCPSCAAMYEVPEAALNRRVRCGRCSNEWIAHAPVAMLKGPEEPVPVFNPGPPRALPGPSVAAPLAQRGFGVSEPDGGPADDSALDRLMDSASKTSSNRSSRAVVALWAASVLLLIGIGAGGYLERDLIMRAWPPSVRLYTSIGLPQADR